MVNSTKSSSITLRRFIFCAVIIALSTSLLLFILEKSHVTNLYKKPLNTTQSPILSGPTNVIDYPIANNNDNTAPEDKQSGTDKPSNSDTLSGTINYKSVTDSVLSIRLTVNQIISTGNCSLKLTRLSDGKQVTKTAEVVQNPSSATCKGFDIPVSELGSGKWNISATVTSGDKSGKIIDEVSI